MPFLTLRQLHLQPNAAILSNGKKFKYFEPSEAPMMDFDLLSALEGEEVLLGLVPASLGKKVPPVPTEAAGGVPPVELRDFLSRRDFRNLLRACKISRKKGIKL